MEIGNVNGYAAGYDTAAQVDNEAKVNSAAKNEAVKVEETKDKQASEAVVYDKNSAQESKATYSINKMSKEDRAALVEQLKADQASREKNLVDIVSKMMSQQTNKYGQAKDIWKFIASGNYTVDAATKAQAQEDISEDGYYGVKQTSQRLFDFASALAGDDVEKMKKMQAAVEKGYKLAEKAWGGELPGISQDTLAATNKLFEDYYASKESEEQ
ncbi:MAG: hypothetical protein NC300_08215 [Bacteroidales bacterium]|nr:hypothetical protein [Clostridium sp.]MCM1204115.1 hypothetical protein [Bacteroidales bacterium]